MAQTNSSPRLGHIDQTKANLVFEARSEYIAKLSNKIAHRGAVPASRRQIVLNSYSLYSRALGLISYALGHSLDVVRTHLIGYLSAFSCVLELRGTTESLRVVSRVGEGSQSADQIDSDNDSNGSTRMVDYSIGNARAGSQAVLYALSLNFQEDAGAISRHVWDPPEAPYVGEGKHHIYSEPERVLAVAVSAVARNEDARALEEISHVIPVARRDACITLECGLIEALAGSDRPRFLDHLNKLLDQHEQRALKSDNRDNSDYYLCVFGIGLARIAVRRSLLRIGELPVESPFFCWDIGSRSGLDVMPSLRATVPGLRIMGS